MNVAFSIQSQGQYMLDSMRNFETIVLKSMVHSMFVEVDRLDVMLIIVLVLKSMVVLLFVMASVIG